MFNWKDEKSRLYAMVAISYGSNSGLKVNEVASNVGQGWNLVAGGVITRIQVGEPDDQMAYGLASEFDLKKYPPGYLYAPVPAANGCPVALTQYPIYGAMNQVYAKDNTIAEDRELDYFSFQFNGKSGIFVLDASNGDKGITLGDSKLKITFQRDPSLATHTSNGIRTSITSFSIQDVDGLIYKFSKHGLTKVLKTEYCSKDLNYKQTQPKFKDGKIYYQAGFDTVKVDPWIINDWFLTEIEDALTHRKVFFNYSSLPRLVDTRAGEDVTYNDAEKNYVIVTYRRSITKMPALENISCPDGHIVTFGYASAQRVDMPGEYAFSEFNMLFQGRYMSRYKLNTTYFIRNRYGTPVLDHQKKDARLCLKSVQKIGVDLKEETLPYIFDYYTGSNAPDDFVPPPFFYAKDIWGYFNGSNTTECNSPFSSLPMNLSIGQLEYSRLKGLCFLRKSNGVHSFNYYTAKPLYARNGLLRQIIYPTGGTLTYEYAQNEGPINGVVQLASGVHVSKTISTNGENCDPAISTSYNYILPNGSSSLWGLEAPLTSLPFTSHYQPNVKVYHWTLSSAPVGECYWKFKFPGILSQQSAISVPDWIHAMNTIAPVLGVINVISTIKNIVTVCTGGSPAALIIDVVLSIVQLAITCIGDEAKDRTVGVYYSNNLNSGNPQPVQFKRVEIVENPGTIGKTIQEFTSTDDYNLWEPNPILSNRQRYAYWAYGLPKKISIIGADGFLVKETINIYNFNTKYAAKCDPLISRFDRTILLKRPLNKISTNCFVTHSTSQKSIDWVNNATTTAYTNSSGGGINVDMYDLYTGRTELDTTIERIYRPNSATDFVETVTNFIYNDDNYEVGAIRTKGSDGRIRQKNIYYTIDFTKTYGVCYQPGGVSTTNSEILNLVQNNIISLPVETNEILLGGAQDKYTYDKATLFTTLLNGDIKPSQILEGRFSEPGIRNSPWPSEHTVYSYYRPGPLLDPANPDYTFYKTAQQLTYGLAGNLTGIKDEGERTVSSIYGFNEKFIIASAINALPNEIFFVPFEESNGWGGTTGIPYGDAPISAFDYTFASHTGKGTGRIDKPTSGEKYCHSDQTLDISLTTPTKYKFSGWVYSNGPAADIFLFMKTSNESFYYTYVDAVSTNVTNQWVYLEKEITVPANITKLNIRLDNNGGGSVWFDDVRLHPASAQMSSYTYDPLIGKTSETDINNRIVFYEYDNVGRMQIIRDEQRNIVKMYEYNSISPSKQNGCPGIYYNRMINESFTKNDCGTGYIGSEVTFTVPANTYSSTKSQDDADAKAEHYILSNGQTYANANGTCLQLYYNAALSQTFSRENCGDSYTGGTYTYTVPAGRYTTIVSQLEADEMAQDDLDANGQAFVNDPANNVPCYPNYGPYWVAEDGAASQCQMLNGEMHRFLWATDMNPNSSSYGQSSWQDMGPDNTCPPSSDFTLFGQNNTNCGQSIVLTNTSTNDQFFFYLSPYSGQSILGYIPAGTYDITISNDCYSSYDYYVACSNSTSGYSGYYTNVPLSSICNFITID